MGVLNMISNVMNLCRVEAIAMLIIGMTMHAVERAGSRQAKAIINDIVLTYSSRRLWYVSHVE